MSNFATGQQSEGLEQTAQATLCDNNCGFFANVGCGGMCSKCHREKASEAERMKAAGQSMVKALAPVTTSVTPAPSARPAIVPQPLHEAAATAATTDSPTASTSTVSAPEPTASGDGSSQKTPCRCFECKKRVGLTGFKCKCGNLYCGQHRLAESHNCPFDYKTLQRQKLAESNPVIQASKIQKI